LAPYDYVLAFLTTMDDPGLVILPTHRVLHTLAPAPAEFRNALAASFRIEELPWTSEGMASLSQRLEDGRGDRTGAAAKIRIGAAVAGAGALWLLTAPAATLPYAADVPP
jgi:hypothetical protein